MPLNNKLRANYLTTVNSYDQDAIQNITNLKRQPFLQMLTHLSNVPSLSSFSDSSAHNNIDMRKCSVHPKQILVSVCVKNGCLKAGAVVCASCISKDHPSHNYEQLLSIYEFLENSDKRVFKSRNSTIAKDIYHTIKMAKQSAEENIQKIMKKVDEAVKKRRDYLEIYEKVACTLEKPLRSMIDQEGGMLNLTDVQLQALYKNYFDAQNGKLSIDLSKIKAIGQATEYLLQGIDRAIRDEPDPPSPIKSQAPQSPTKSSSSNLPTNMQYLMNLASIMEKTDRYQDMIEVVKKMISLNENPTKEQRRYFSVAYKNTVGPIRSALRTIKESKTNSEACINYGTQLLNELSMICNGVISLLDLKILPAAKEPYNQVFFLKMKADYYRFKSEHSTGNVREAASTKSYEAYIQANSIAQKLNTTNAVRLGNVLNYGVYLHEIKNDNAKAIKINQEAFDLAINDIDNIEPYEYKDCTTIMQLIRDNITLWKYY